MPATTLPDLIADAQTTEERFLRQIFVRDQMAEWSKNPLIMARAEGVHYWDVHGKKYLGALSDAGLKGRKTVNEPMAPGFVHVFPPTCYRCPFGKTYPTCKLTCVTLIGDVIEMEDPDTVAAVMVEPIGHTGGVIDPPDEYLPILREVCDRYGALLIFDEIITGIGRTGRLFAAETFGVTPDVLCLAKGLG